VIAIHQRYRHTDGQTDRQTTCDRNTALCTKVHRAVKTLAQDDVFYSYGTATITVFIVEENNLVAIVHE